MIANKAIYLTLAEFYILLAQRKFLGLVIFEEIKKYTPNIQDIAQGMFSLTEKGILIAAEDKCYHMSQYVKTVLDILEEAKSTFVVNGCLSCIPMQCLYFGREKCLLLQMDDFRDGIIRIELTDRPGAINGFLECEFMPDADILRCESEESDVMDGIELAEEYLNRTNTDLLYDEAVLMIVERYLVNSSVPDKRAIVFSAEGNYFLAVATDEEKHVGMFETEAFFNLFLE